MNKPSLLLVDPYVGTKAPSMRSLVQAIDSFRHQFAAIEVWSTECDLKGVDFTKVECLSPVWTLIAAEFRWRVRRMMSRQTKEWREGRIVLCTGENLLDADIRYLHFWHGAFLEAQRSFGKIGGFGIKDRLISEFTQLEEQRIARQDGICHWWVVSRNLAAKVEAEVSGDAQFAVLPNSYDPSRFNPERRLGCRGKMRAHYGFDEDTAVFVFSAMGHFARKGLGRAVRAVALLEEQGHNIRLLVLGGRERAISVFRSEMIRKGISLNSVTFSGPVSPIEDHLSAADGLLFPSHFEAFSFAEIEAAALGLRLYLTPHYGHEMILREPVNGRLLPWDPEGMAKVLEEEIDKGVLQTGHREMGEAVSVEEFATRIGKLFEDRISQWKREASESLVS